MWRDLDFAIGSLIFIFIITAPLWGILVTGCAMARARAPRPAQLAILAAALVSLAPVAWWSDAANETHKIGPIIGVYIAMWLLPAVTFAGTLLVARATSRRAGR
jgi:hypothetical protein